MQETERLERLSLALSRFVPAHSILVDLLNALALEGYEPVSGYVERTLQAAREHIRKVDEHEPR
jgi:hypothetical protein